MKKSTLLIVICLIAMPLGYLLFNHDNNTSPVDLNKLPFNGLYFLDPSISVIIKNKEATDLFDKATQYLSGNPTQEDIDNGLKSLKKSAILGEPNAEYMLAVMYLSGKILPVNRKIAKSYLEQSCRQEHREACSTLKLLRNNKI